MERDLVACTCNATIVEGKMRSLGSVPDEGNSPSVCGLIVWRSTIQHKVRNLASGGSRG